MRKISLKKLKAPNFRFNSDNRNEKYQVKQMKNYTRNKEVSVSQSVKKVLEIILTKSVMET